MIQLVAKQSPKEAGKTSPKDVNQTKYGLTKEVNFTIIFKRQ